jgi:hypothetical protein
VDDRHYLLGCESRGSLCRRRPARSICFHTQLSNGAGRRLARRADHQTTILNKLPRAQWIVSPSRWPDSISPDPAVSRFGQADRRRRTAQFLGRVAVEMSLTYREVRGVPCSLLTYLRVPSAMVSSGLSSSCSVTLTASFVDPFWSGNSLSAASPEVQTIAATRSAFGTTSPADVSRGCPCRCSCRQAPGSPTSSDRS